MRDHTTLIAEIDPNELIVRMLEAARGNERPEGMTARELVAALDPDVVQPMRAMALVATEYIAQQITAAHVVDP